MTRAIPGQRFAKIVVPREDPGENEQRPIFHERAVSFFISLTFHMAVLLVLALFVYPHVEDTPLIEVLDARMEFLPEPEPTALTMADLSVEEQIHADENTDSSQALDDVRQLANAAASSPVTVAVLSHQRYLPTTMPRDGLGFGGDALFGLGESAGTGLIAGNSDAEQGDGEVGFFGTKAKGKSFVFIVDCSGSMTTATGVIERKTLITRFLRARQELYLSLGQLARDQKFYIIFYNHNTFPMYFPQPIKAMAPANADHLRLARNWIQDVVPGGGTDPRQAFRIALALRPDVIFFLTDGAIPPVTRRVAKENNKSRTRIHTIAFGILEHQDILQGIAQDNQGRFRFVP